MIIRLTGLNPHANAIGICKALARSIRLRDAKAIVDAIAAGEVREVEGDEALLQELRGLGAAGTTAT